MTSERLQKVLANAGYASRREIETWIEAGRITVNGKRAKLGVRTEPDDLILLDGRPVRTSQGLPETIQALIYNKPEGEICTRKDDKGRPTVFEGLPKIVNGRWVSVGRLDINTSGLLLFTNNGDLANKLMHPSTGLEREYLVRVRGQATTETLNTLLKKGVDIDGKLAKFDSILASEQDNEGSNYWYRVVLREGRYREVRRMWAAVGHSVSRLKRIRYGTIKITRDVRQGNYVKVAPKQLEKLIVSVGLEDQFKGLLYSSSRAGSTGKKISPRRTSSSARNTKNTRSSRDDNSTSGTGSSRPKDSNRRTRSTSGRNKPEQKQVSRRSRKS